MSKPRNHGGAGAIEAQLHEDHCPVAGIVLKRSAEVGEHVSAGQQLLTIAQIGDIWVTANFKETQLRNIHPGQSARIHVDALRQDFEGYVENIGGGTGAVSSVLPPENATGNYVKVVQRIPVRLRFKPNQNGSGSPAPRHVRGAAKSASAANLMLAPHELFIPVAHALVRAASPLLAKPGL